MLREWNVFLQNNGNQDKSLISTKVKYVKFPPSGISFLFSCVGNFFHLPWGYSNALVIILVVKTGSNLVFNEEKGRVSFSLPAGFLKTPFDANIDMNYPAFPQKGAILLTYVLILWTFPSGFPQGDLSLPQNI